MSVIWNKLIQCQDDILKIFDEKATEIEEKGLNPELPTAVRS